MSRTGSGLKTLLLVLLHLYLVPDVHKEAGRTRPFSHFLFGFEELENNLHPSLQRRLFRYLRQVATSERCGFFLTTHSHVVIDLFSRDEQAQIIHVKHDGECARAERITTYVNHRNVFEDLEVRASDLLQTNAIVWVEGPSDRIYFNKWVELWTEGKLREHVDYEVCFTAGSLLAHYSFDDPSSEEELIAALKINCNAIVLIDSDKKHGADDPPKKRAKRVLDEVRRLGGISWLTAGREVENYIPYDVLQRLLNKEEVKPEDEFVDLFKFIEEEGGSNYSRRKVDLAERVCQFVTKESLGQHLDLAEQLDEVCEKIKQWNHRR